jgi:hypothetical protein
MRVFVHMVIGHYTYQSVEQALPQVNTSKSPVITGNVPIKEAGVSTASDDAGFATRLRLLAALLMRPVADGKPRNSFTVGYDSSGLGNRNAFPNKSCDIVKALRTTKIFLLFQYVVRQNSSGSIM